MCVFGVYSTSVGLGQMIMWDRIKEIMSNRFIFPMLNKAVFISQMSTKHYK